MTRFDPYVISAETASAIGVQISRDGDFAYWDFDARRFQNKTLTFASNGVLLRQFAADPRITALITSREAIDQIGGETNIRTDVALYLSPNPRLAFFALHSFLATVLLASPGSKSVYGTGCHISSSAEIDDMGVVLGNGVVIESGCRIYRGVKIGDGCRIGSGCVIGGEGFQYLRIGKHGTQAVPHIGTVEIDDDVTLHARVCVDRGIFLDATRIGRGSRIDTQVHVGHAVRIGRDCLIASGAVLCGGVFLQDCVWVGPNATISDSLTLGSDALVSIGSVVIQNVPEGTRVSGNFAAPHHLFMKAFCQTYVPQARAK